MSTFSRYLADTYPPLEESYQQDLVARAVAGDKAARDLLVLHNNRLILSRLKRFRIPTDIDGYPDDVIQDATMGLMKAIEKFDPTSGTLFSTYAVWWIDQAIHLWLYDDKKQRNLYISRHFHDRIQVVKHLQREGLKRAQIAERMGKSQEEIEQVFDYINIRYPSLDRQLMKSDGDENNNLAASIADETSMDAYEAIEYQDELESQRAQLLALMEHTLLPRERELVRLHYGIGCPATSVTTIAEAAQISRQRIDQVLRKAMHKLSQATGASIPNSKELRAS